MSAEAHTNTSRALKGLKIDERAMTRIAESPSGPNPRRLAATGSSDGDTNGASDEGEETCSRGFNGPLS